MLNNDWQVLVSISVIVLARRHQSAFEASFRKPTIQMGLISRVVVSDHNIAIESSETRFEWPQRQISIPGILRTFIREISVSELIEAATAHATSLTWICSRLAQ